MAGLTDCVARAPATRSTVERPPRTYRTARRAGGSIPDASGYLRALFTGMQTEERSLHQVSEVRCIPPSVARHGWRRASTPGRPSTAGLRNPLKTTWSSSRPPRPPSVPAPPTASTAQCRASLACRRQRRFVSWSPHELTARHAAAGPASCVPHARPRRRAARSRSEAPRTARSSRALHARHPVPHNPNQVDGSRPVIFTGALLPVLEAASQ